MDRKEIAAESRIFASRTGSHAYGMATPLSDLDIRGVFAAPPMSVMTPFFRMDEVEGPPGTDEKYFELTKYINLVTSQNPNIVELLWVDDEDVLHTTPAWEMLKKVRGDLLTTKVRATYGGYATQALRQLKSRDKWINKPQPEEAPLPKDFVSMVHNFELGPEFNTKVPRVGDWTAVNIGRDLYVLYQTGNGGWFEGAGNLRTYSQSDAANLIKGVKPAAIIKFNRDQYDKAKKDHASYWTWKKERNQARSEVEARVGYDGKNAAHLIRLLRTAHEALSEGVIRVRRPDAEELLCIRRGEWSLDQVLDEAERIDAGLEEAEKNSPLARSIDMTMVGKVVMDMYHSMWSRDASLQVKNIEHQEGVAPDMRGRVIIADCEGTGYHNKGRKRICEVAAVEIVGGVKTGRVFHSFVNPEARINPYATAIHGLTEGFLEGQPTFDRIQDGLREFIGDSPIVFHGAVSDAAMLRRDLDACGGAPLPDTQIICSLRIGKRLFGGAELSLDKMCDAFEIDRTARDRGHSALVDANLLASCMFALADMQGYEGLTGVGLKKTREDRIKNKRTEVDVEEGVVLFFEKDEILASTDLPVYPEDTHEHIVASNGSIIIRKQGERIPDNPEGPAIVSFKDGKIQKRWFENGEQAPRRDGDEEAQSAAMMP